MNRQASVTQIGLDGHRTFSILSGRDASGATAWREHLRHQDREAMRRQWAEFPKGTPVILEATFGWGWMSDELMAVGLRPYLANSRKVAAWRTARGLAKSNRTDADLLSELPMAEGGRWWEVWLAPPEVREQREWLRYRMSLVHIQTGVKNRIHAVLHRHGIVNEHADLFGREGRRMLKALALNDPRVPASGRATLTGHMQLLDFVRRLIAQATRELRRQVKRSPAGERLRTLPGIDFILAYTIMAEVGRIERFAGSKRLASYSLLAPRAYDSGEEDPDAPPLGRHVGHAGRQTLQWAWIEAAHSAARSDVRLGAIFDRRTNGGKRDRNRGYIAVAHALCRMAYSLWKQGRDYTEESPLRPGTKASGRVPSAAAKKARQSRKRCERRARAMRAACAKTTEILRESNVTTEPSAPATAPQAAAERATLKQMSEGTSRPGLGLPDHPMVVAE